MKTIEEAELKIQPASPKVSVVMPICNAVPHDLEEAIDSILAQTFTDFEFLILNDSPDNMDLDRVVNSHSDSRISYVKNAKNLGIEESLNKLIDLSRGEYLAIFDHADISLPDRLEKETEYLDAHPGVGVASAQFTVFGIQNWISNNPINDSDIKKRLETESCVSHTAMMVRKPILAENNIRYEKAFFPESSYRIITRLALVTEIHNLPDVLLKYKMNDNDTSTRYAEEGVEVRDRLRIEYAEDSKALRVKNLYGFGTVERFGSLRRDDERRYYKCTKDGTAFFVKSGDCDYATEYEMTRRVFERDKEHFVEPIDYHKGESSYLVTSWCDGISLDEYLGAYVLSRELKESFFHDLYAIFKVLRDAKIMHRDLIPRNFMVMDGRLMLLDFYWAVDCDNYQEYAYAKKDLELVGFLGEDFAAGPYTWDDAFSLVKIAGYIAGDDEANKNSMIQEISKHIGERVITPNMAAFRDTIASWKNCAIAQRDYAIEQRDCAASRQTQVDELSGMLAEKNQQIAQILNSKRYRLACMLVKPLTLIRKLLKYE